MCILIYDSGSGLSLGSVIYICKFYYLHIMPQWRVRAHLDVKLQNARGLLFIPARYNAYSMLDEPALDLISRLLSRNPS